MVLWVKKFSFNKSIKENIFDGNIVATEEMYSKALEVSHTIDFLKENNISDNEIITQTQDNLSGGQLKEFQLQEH